VITPSEGVKTYGEVIRVSQQGVNSNTHGFSVSNVIVYSKQSTIQVSSQTPIVISTCLVDNGFVPQTVIVWNPLIVRLTWLPLQSSYSYGKTLFEVLINVKQLQVTTFVGVGVGVIEFVGVTVGVVVWVGVGLGVGLGLALGVLVTVGVTVLVGVILGVTVGVRVTVGVNVGVGVFVGVTLGVTVGVGVDGT
jgi:hypothetical protein